MKKQPILWYAAGLIVVCGLVVLVTTRVASRYLQLSSPSDTCNSQPASHHYYADIRNSTISPGHITGSVCDRLTITNYDNVERLIAFGPHDDHVPYDGVGERILKQGQSLSVTLDQAGTFTYHDHLDDDVVGSFTVTK